MIQLVSDGISIFKLIPNNKGHDFIVRNLCYVLSCVRLRALQPLSVFSINFE